MKVILAETAGFCMGVDMALRKLDTLIDEAGERPIYILGPIIHNPQVLQRYGELGVTMAQVPEDVPDGAYVVIRAHGIPRQVEESLAGRDIKIKDATCPRVKKAQLLIARHTAEGRELLLYGEADHPEVAGLVSYAADGYFVFGSAEEMAAHALSKNDKYVLAAQTTQDRNLFDTLVRELVDNPKLDVTVLQTICDATKSRQKEAKQLAHKVDFMVVIGGLESGNTRRLAQVVSDEGTPSVHVETVDSLNLDDLRQHATIGVTAGASTPHGSINDVLSALESL